MSFPVNWFMIAPIGKIRCMQCHFYFNEIVIVVLVCVELMCQLFVWPLNEVIKQKRITCRVKLVNGQNGQQHYGNPLLQNEILLNLKNFVQTVTHIFECNLYVRLQDEFIALLMCA